MTLSDLIQQPRFESPAQEAVLNVLATESWVASRMSDALARYGVTTAQYNVLRILRGHTSGPMTCSQIGSRLLDRTPDVTRLLARLERAGLVTRTRAEHDRRAVEVAITDAGRTVLAALDTPARDAVDRLARHLSEDELATLSSLLERLRSDQT
ncbi:MAG TPA: MarR family transcriptional regulator [Rubricoccaceae bacterium]